jgi:hypothetical protein
VEVVRLFCTSCPDAALLFFQQLMASSPMMSSVLIRGRLFGKESSTTLASSTRSILPLPAVLQVVDCLLSSLLHSIIDKACPPVPGCFVGARPHAQVLDIAHGLHLVIEKALDGHSQGAVAQQDIASYYDSIRLLRVARWLVANGAPMSLAASALRHQMLPQVSLSVGGLTIPMNNRSRGSITGSRVAGALGRVLVESTLRDRHTAWRSSGFSTADRTLVVAGYVDNIYSAGRSLGHAINILDQFEQHLQTTWGLSIKPSSRACMTPRGSRQVPKDAVKWQLCSEFHVLGHILQDNGSTNACWNNTSNNM